MIYDSIQVLVNQANKVTTKAGNTYYKIPYWFKVSPDGNLIEFLREMPDDLAMFITKAGLGAPNPQIERPKK
jgi:hypothetical protein